MSSKDIASFFRFEPTAKRIEDLETPTPIIDIDVVDRNLKRWQERCDKLGIANRPHIKTHKLAPLAKYQMALGAKGITVQKLGEAEVMADAGIRDMLLTFNVVGAHKLKRLADLARRTDISVVADNETVVEGLGRAGVAAGRDIAVLVECDTGAKRNGVQSPEAAAALAKVIDRTKGVSYGGLMTYAAPAMRIETEAFLTAARDRVAEAGLETRVITSGGSPDMWKDEGLGIVSEYRVGTYVYFDRSLVERGTCAFDDCALGVLATVVSRPTDERALVDAGSKSLTSDLLGLKGYGVVHAMGDAQIYMMSEEHGFLDISGAAMKPKVGDLVRITPNHVCPVTNLFDRVVFVRGTEVLGAVKVDARGTVQ
ncbi:D-TA family PLP-dependent enzyme [Nordella sp. HKS 07]|uniref:alanine racemase n=1 Tax=Nordella sp. HKS 07 TaxID=2712222 RepID=UPI0013E1CADE|nr:alanine racemase [Nordella sp. HKS 07]QIG47683.1 D-TA family PLP-dependent enzyme [Nordella sp. HKS 07]